MINESLVLRATACSLRSYMGRKHGCRVKLEFCKRKQKQPANGLVKCKTVATGQKRKQQTIKDSVPPKEVGSDEYRENGERKMEESRNKKQSRKKIAQDLIASCKRPMITPNEVLKRVKTR